MVIFYDQYGCGRSTHFPHADASFWTIARYLRQLTQLIHHLGIGHGYSILGHSWGGMLAAEHACLQPAGLRGTILASSPPTLRVITFYGEPMNWRQMANLPTGILRPICARYAVLFWYYAAKTIRQPSASSLRCSLTFQTAARSLFLAAAITRMKKISRPASQR